MSSAKKKRRSGANSKRYEKKDNLPETGGNIFKTSPLASVVGILTIVFGAAFFVFNLVIRINNDEGINDRTVIEAEEEAITLFIIASFITMLCGIATLAYIKGNKRKKSHFAANIVFRAIAALLFFIGYKDRRDIITLYLSKSSGTQYDVAAAGLFGLTVALFLGIAAMIGEGRGQRAELRIKK